jgi:uncharacterized repeat protein (TIGR04138 family)
MAWNFWQRNIFTPAHMICNIEIMPPPPEPKQQSLIQTEPDAGLFPPHAFEFIHEGLDFTVTHVHGPRCRESNSKMQMEAPPNRHVSGQQLCEGLRELALAKWGRMARTVLRRWNITSTLDFGRIVYSLIEAGQMQKVEDDSLDDFKNVYDFKAAFETEYRIPGQS